MRNKRLAIALSFCLLAIGCKGSGSRAEVLSAGLPLHLEDHIGAARITGSEVPKNLPDPLEFRFDQDGPAWKPAVVFTPGLKPPQAARQDGALRVTLTKDNRNPWGFRQGVVYVDLPDLSLDDWGFIVVEARTKEGVPWMSTCFNLRERQKNGPARQPSFEAWGDTIDVITDGEAHSYLITAQAAGSEGLKGPWRQLGIAVGSSEREAGDSRKGPISIDILSVRVVTKDAAYAGARMGIVTEPWGETGRRALYAHVPGKIEYDVKIPERGRLDIGLGVLKKTSPVKFKISALETAQGARRKALLDETCSAEGPRSQRSIDLSPYAGKTVTLTLETEAEGPGNVAFWGAPTLSGPRNATLPNVIFYVIDGAAAELMSVYGYNRRTTPYLERLAAEGAVFEHAYSSSSWTQVSVTSFMTSLHSSVLGGYSGDSSPLPEQAVTMAERLHKAGYTTEVLTSNPYCGRMSGLDRGVDIVRDADPEENDEKPADAASAALHRSYWEFRGLYPGEPYWVHFQPTDVHWPWKPSGSFAGLFSTLEERQALDDIFEKMKKIQWT
ncbi:MAG TPA: sulfatase-like hydrolase/transferase, partial [Acidobacteriota bacterium]|nr:sulfatase-like hydrolase/transferase [Acidobacteriota bacterium]